MAKKIALKDSYKMKGELYIKNDKIITNKKEIENGNWDRMIIWEEEKKIKDDIFDRDDYSVVYEYAKEIRENKQYIDWYEWCSVNDYYLKVVGDDGKTYYAVEV